MASAPWSGLLVRFASSAACRIKKMPPKKAEVPAPKPLLGRPSNNLKMGVVGLPNVGYPAQARASGLIFD